MWRYFLKRCLWLIFVLVGTACVIFTIMYMVPGDTVSAMFGGDASQAQMEAMRDKMGLNDTYIVQLGRYLYNLFIKFDLGTSVLYNQPVVDELMRRLPRTMALGWTSIILNTLAGIPLGVMAALHQNKWQDNLCMGIALLGVSTADFWRAFIFIMVFSVHLNWLPPFGTGGIQYYILPILSIVFSGIAVNARLTRSSMLEVMRADYISTARSKGISERKVTLKHMLPNALLPVITSMGNGLGNAIAGTVIIETIFSIPGIGTYLLKGINMRDYAIVEGSVVILAFFNAIIQMLVDLVYALIDPRIKAQYSGK